MKTKAGIDAKYVENKRFKNVDDFGKVCRILCEKREREDSTNDHLARKNVFSPY